MPADILQFHDLTLGYGSHPAVHHLSGTVEAGSLLAVVGANGSGKSTLLKGVAGLVKPMSGSIRRDRHLPIAYLPQLSEVDRDFPARVMDVVSLGLWSRRGLLGRMTQADRDAVVAALHAVGLDGFAERPIDTLSGGQFQRALFARVIVQDARLILLDEPFNAVDAATSGDLMTLIQGWQAEGRTVIAVSHDFALVRRSFPRTLLLARRVVAWGDTAQVLRRDNLAEARHFAEAWSEDAPWCEPAGVHSSHDTHDHGSHRAGAA